MLQMLNILQLFAEREYTTIDLGLVQTSNFTCAESNISIRYM